MYIYTNDQANCLNEAANPYAKSINPPRYRKANTPRTARVCASARRTITAVFAPKSMIWQHYP